MVTYKDATQAVRNRWVNQQRKRMDLRALLLIIAFKLDFGILDYKKHECSLSNKQTIKIKLYTFCVASVYPWPLKSEHLNIFEDIYQLWSVLRCEWRFPWNAFLNSVIMNNHTVQSVWYWFSYSFDYLPQVHIWFRLCK